MTEIIIVRAPRGFDIFWKGSCHMDSSIADFLFINITYWASEGSELWRGVD